MDYKLLKVIDTVDKINLIFAALADRYEDCSVNFNKCLYQFKELQVVDVHSTRFTIEGDVILTVHFTVNDEGGMDHDIVMYDDFDTKLHILFPKEAKLQDFYQEIVNDVIISSFMVTYDDISKCKLKQA